MAATGAVVNQAGACAMLLTPAILATGSSLRRFASLARISTSAAAPSEIELELAAVTVPPSRKAGLSFGILAGSRRERLLVLLDLGDARTPLHRDAHDLLGERAVLIGRLRALQALDGEGVLRLARELIVLRGVLRVGAHQAALVVGVLETVEEHVVLDLGVAEPGAGAHLGQQVGRIGHALHAAGDDDIPAAAHAAPRRPSSPSSCPSRTSC